MKSKNAKRKVQIGVKPIGGDNIVKSRKMARRITSQFHDIHKRKQKILSMKNGTERDSALQSLETELEDLGGIDRYQKASVISTQHFKTSRWVLQSLRRLNILPAEKKLKTLEVGAINDQLFQSSALEVRAIDVNSQLPCIEERDFFSIIPECAYDVVVCSMVINCVFHPIKRGEMLLRLLCQLKPEGVLFLILPTRCLRTEHVRSVSEFQSVLEAIGFVLAEPVHNTPHLTFFSLRIRPEWLECNKNSPQSSPWIDKLRSYFTSPDFDSASFPPQYRSTKSFDSISETETFSVLFSKDYFK